LPQGGVYPVRRVYLLWEVYPGGDCPGALAQGFTPDRGFTQGSFVFEGDCPIVLHGFDFDLQQHYIIDEEIDQ